MEGNTPTSYTGRVLVCADGATSRLAMKLGLVTDPPRGSCSRAFVEGHKFKADGVVFYHKPMLPGLENKIIILQKENEIICYCVMDICRVCCIVQTSK